MIRYQFSGDERVTTVPPEEDSWWAGDVVRQAASVCARAAIVPLAALQMAGGYTGDELPAPPAVTIVDEPVQRTPSPIPPAAYIQPGPFAADEVTPSVVEDDGYRPWTIAPPEETLVVTVYLLDDAAVFALPGDEDGYRSPVPWQVVPPPPQPWQSPSDEIVAAPAPIVDDDPGYSPRSIAPIVLPPFVVVGDDVLGFTAPPVVEDDASYRAWVVFSPPMVRGTVDGGDLGFVPAPTIVDDDPGYQPPKPYLVLLRIAEPWAWDSLGAGLTGAVYRDYEIGELDAAPVRYLFALVDLPVRYLFDVEE